jgi:hypothetical protein
MTTYSHEMNKMTFKPENSHTNTSFNLLDQERKLK